MGLFMFNQICLSTTLELKNFLLSSFSYWNRENVSVLFYMKNTSISAMEAGK